MLAEVARNPRHLHVGVTFNRVLMMQLQTIGSAPGQARPRSRRVVTVEEVQDRLVHAVGVIAAMPNAGCRPRGYGAGWGFALGGSGRVLCDDVPELTPSAITSADEALSWLALLPDDRQRERKIVLMRAAGWIWERIGNEVGLSHEGARRAHLVAVRLIVRALTGNRNTLEA